MRDEKNGVNPYASLAITTSRIQPQDLPAVVTISGVLPTPVNIHALLMGCVGETSFCYMQHLHDGYTVVHSDVGKALIYATSTEAPCNIYNFVKSFECLTLDSPIEVVYYRTTIRVNYSNGSRY